MKSISIGLASAILGSAITYLALKVPEDAGGPGGAGTNGSFATGAGHGSATLPKDGEKPELTMAQKAKLRSRAESAEQLQEIGAMRRQPLARFRTVDFRRKLNPVALEAAGIPESEMQAVQREFDQAWMDVEKLISELATVSPPKQQGDPYVVEVRGEVEQGNQFLDSLKKRLEEKFGAKASEVLMSGYDDGRMLGSFGRQNQRIEIRYNEEDKQWEVRYFHSNPLTGDVTRKGDSSLEKFKELNGDWVANSVNLHQ
jgi:hypothetical protein